MSLPEGTFKGKLPEVRTSMELRFVLRDRLPEMTATTEVASVGDLGTGSESAGTPVISSPSQASHEEGVVSGRSTEQSPASTSTPMPVGTGTAPREQPAPRVQNEPDDTGDGRSVVFRQNAPVRGMSSSRPVITAATREPVYAMYYRTLRSRIEHLGHINFPQKNGYRLYGELTVRIPISRNGAIAEHEGGVSIERSSGNHDLDSAALNIVRRAAPFGPFPRNAQTSADVWVIITRLKFTREPGHQPQIQATVR
ncbi:MAG: TonB family protein [Oxalobacter sp.]|nr:TonB family protein [Oxalobacter sp.]